MKEIDVEECKRYKFKHKGEDVYLIYGPDFVDVKFPYENRPERKDEKDFARAICEMITEIKQVEIYNNSLED